MKKFYILFYLIFYSVIGYSQWTPQISGITEDLRSIYFVDATTGYAIGGKTFEPYNGIILKTTNGGTSWYLQSTGINCVLNSIFFIDINTGYFVGDAGPNGGVIKKTTNGGESWSNINCAFASFLKSVFFFDANNGYIVGSSREKFIRELIGKTTNAGQSWSIYTTPNNSYLISIFFPDSINGYAIGRSGHIFGTHDGGLTWTDQSIGEAVDLESIYFTNANTGYVVQGQKIKKTTNSGQSWDSQTFTTYFHSIYFVDADTGYVVGSQNAVLKTTNKGANWTTQYNGPNYFLNSVFFTDFNTGYACGDHGIIIKYSNGILGRPATPIGPKSICINAPNTVCTTTGIYGATSYIWEISPSSAGTISGDSLKGTINWNDTYIGLAQITVKGHNNMGDGAVSKPLLVNIYNKPVTPFITLNFNILHADSPSGNQWYNESGLISGATNQDFLVSVNGDYYDIVTINACSSDTSNTLYIRDAEIDVRNNSKIFSIYPVPAKEKITITIQGQQNITSIILNLYNIHGQRIFQRILQHNDTEINISQLPQGIYIAMLILIDGTIERQKFVLIK